MRNLPTDDSGRNSDLLIGGGLLGDDFLSDDEDVGTGRKSINPD